MSNLSRSALLLALLVAPACTVGEVIGGPSGGDDIGVGGDDTTEVGPDAAAAPDFGAIVSPGTISTTLGTTSKFTVTIDSYNFSGSVSLAATGVPTGWTATFTPATLTVPLDGSVTAELAIVVPSDAIASTASIGVSAVGAPGTRTSVGSLAVANEYVLAIGAVGNGAHAFPGTLRLPLGAQLKIKNADTIGHRIHSDGGLGFPHQEATMPAGAEYTVTPGEAAAYNFYCHDHGVGTGVTNLVVQ